MGMGGKIIIIFALSLFASSYFIAYFEQSFIGTNDVQVIELPIDASGFNMDVPFSNTTSSCDLTKFYVTGSPTCLNNGGITVINGGIEYKNPTNGNGEGRYTSTYHIISHTGTLRITLAGNDNGQAGYYLYITDNKLSIKNWLTNADAWKASYDSSSQDLVIDTLYDSNDRYISFTINGQTFEPDLITGFPWTLFPNWHDTWGISSTGSFAIDGATIGFTQQSSGITQALDALKLTGGTVMAMAKLCTFSFPYDILPWQTQFVLIFPQEFCLFIGILIFLREG